MKTRTSTQPAAPRSYVVRIYRRTASELVGQVQDVHTGSVRMFRTLAGLWAVLGGRKSSPKKDTASKEQTR